MTPQWCASEHRVGKTCPKSCWGWIPSEFQPRKSSLWRARGTAWSMGWLETSKWLCLNIGCISPMPLFTGTIWDNDTWPVDGFWGQGCLSSGWKDGTGLVVFRHTCGLILSVGFWGRRKSFRRERVTRQQARTHVHGPFTHQYCEYWWVNRLR